MELSTDQKGAIAESAIVHAAIKLGIGVFRPVTDGHRYDLVFDFFRNSYVSNANGLAYTETSSSSGRIRIGERRPGC